MKKIIFILAVLGMVVSSCGNKKQKEKAATHTHDDGSVHAGETHVEASETMPKQESFEVEVEEINEHEHSSEEHGAHN